MVLPPTRPALRARYEHRRREVVAVAARVFALQGFHATSMQDLVSATGLTAGGLYHYFSSKDALLVDICDVLMEPLLAQAGGIVQGSGSAEERLRQLLHAWLVHVERHRDHMLVFQQERHVLERGPQWRRVRRQRKEFETLLAQLIDELADGPPDRDLALRALLGMVNHTPQWFRSRGRLSAGEVADGYLEILLGRNPH